MEDVRKSVAKLFGEDYISLDSLDNVKSEEKGEFSPLNILDSPVETETTINLGILDRPVHVPKQKCPHLSPLINCNVGGFAHLGCMDEAFHAHCKFRAAHEKRERSRR